MNVRPLFNFSVALAAWMALLGVGVGCVYAKHEARKRFVALGKLEQERDELEVEWNRLRLEQRTWSNHNRIDNIAREALEMSVPVASDIAVIEQ
ncbi:MAG: cell division protein FtsL [Gammaproteobacteria bacterium]